MAFRARHEWRTYEGRGVCEALMPGGDAAARADASVGSTGSKGSAVVSQDT